MSIAEFASFLGGISYFVGSIAVVITLVYLSKQVKHAKQEVALLGRQTRANHAANVLSPIVSSCELAPIFAKLDLIDYGSFGLSKEESIRFGAWFHTWLQAEQGSFYLLPKGAHDPLLNWMLATPAGAEFWKKNKGVYDTEFVEHVEELRIKMETAADPIQRCPQEQARGSEILSQGIKSVGHKVFGARLASNTGQSLRNRCFDSRAFR